MSNSQELITPELAKKIAEYEIQVRKWRADKTTGRRGALYAVILAVPFWIVSYLASAETGPVNQAIWFSALTMFAFVGALGATIAAIVLGGVVVLRGKPVREFIMENEIS